MCISLLSPKSLAVAAFLMAQRAALKRIYSVNFKDENQWSVFPLKKCLYKKEGQESKTPQYSQDMSKKKRTIAAHGWGVNFYRPILPLIFGVLFLLMGGPIASATKPDLSWVEEIKVTGPTVNVKELGAKGDGLTNDSEVFRRASELIEQAGGGTLVIPPGTYIVGEQESRPWGGPDGKIQFYAHRNIISIKGVNGLLIEGNGAKLKLASGLRYGSFDNEGKAIDPEVGGQANGEIKLFVDFSCKASVGSMIGIYDSEGVIIRNLELDGNSGELILGGNWGDAGRQIEAEGIRSTRNRYVVLENIHSHHHGEDGIYVNYANLTEGDLATPHLLKGVVSEYNGRQGLSWVGGIGLTAIGCKFNHTGQGAFCSMPGAGFDIEAELSVCRNGYLEDCEFINNRNTGMVSDSGDGGHTKFVNCLFWATGDEGCFAIWCRKPGLKFEDCKVYGSGVHAYGSDDPEMATSFLRCTFEDKPWTNGKVSRSAGQLYTVDGAGNNVSWKDCTFIANTVRSVWIKANKDARVTLDGCTFIHKYGDLEDKEYQAILTGVVIKGCKFEEDFQTVSGASYWLQTADSIVEQGDEGSETVVHGPQVRWGSWSEYSGKMGVILPTQQQ
jgi:hypothetical protein